MRTTPACDKVLPSGWPGHTRKILIELLKCLSRGSEMASFKFVVRKRSEGSDRRPRCPGHTWNRRRAMCFGSLPKMPSQKCRYNQSNKTVLRTGARRVKYRHHRWLGPVAERQPGYG